MALVDTRGYNLTPDIVGSLASGMQLGQAVTERERQEQIRGLLAQQQQRVGVTEGGVTTTQPAIPQDEMMRRVRAIDPIQAEQLFKSMGLDDKSKRAEFSSFAGQLQAMPFEQREGYIKARAEKLKSEGRDPTETLKLLTVDEQTQNQALQGVQLADLSTKERFAVADQQRATGPKIGTYNPRDYTVQSFAEFRSTGDPAVLERYTEKTIDVGGVPHQFDPESESYKPIVTTEKIASNRAKIAAAVKQAESSAKSSGEDFSAYGRAKAALPGLLEVTNKLSKLSDIATYTTTGKAFNFMVKELGFGATKGATARASMTALVNNQVLPLLRETFGAAFTKAEGDSLKATLLDVDASPEEKKATLKSFIDQKVRNLQTSERQLGIEDQTQLPEKDVSLMSDEELEAEAARLRGQK